MLPQTLKAPLLEHLKRAKSMHDHDLADGRGRVLLPDAIDRKYPSAPGEWRWQWVFPQENRWKNEKTSEEGRHHVHESIIQKAVNSAVRKAGLAKRATCHTFRHSFATQLLEKWIRHQDGAGTSRPQGRENRHDLHPRPQPGRQGCQESRGRFVEEKRRCFIQKPYIPPRTVQKTACCLLNVGFAVKVSQVVYVALSLPKGVMKKAYIHCSVKSGYLYQGSYE
jgi:hypothetical protein